MNVSNIIFNSYHEDMQEEKKITKVNETIPQ